MMGEVLFYRQLWAISSAGERFLHTEEVAGSRPASPTIYFCGLQGLEPVLSIPG